MPGHMLTPEERSFLLKLAREALSKAVRGESLPPLVPEDLPPPLLEPGATFVTLTYKGKLRGCIGTLEPYQPLAEDVREHAAAAALNDFRFPPVQPEELPHIRIEVSRLTQPQPLDYQKPLDLPKELRPAIDGVVIKDGCRKATFLPQVWNNIPDPEEFLAHLCMKMGATPNLWKYKKLEVLTYQVEEFHE